MRSAAAFYRRTNGGVILPLPTFTWRMSAMYTISPLTAAGIINAINTAFAAEGVYWGVNFFSSTFQVELKRIGPPAGELTTARILFFGTSTPNASATDDTRSTGNIYQMLCVDANSGAGGPPVSFTAGNPYSSATGNTGGLRTCTPGVASGAYVWFAECSEGVVINVSRDPIASSQRAYISILGRFWDDFSGTPAWLNLGATGGSALDGNGPRYTSTVSDSMGTSTCVASPTNTNRTEGARSGSSVITDLGHISDSPMIDGGHLSALGGAGRAAFTDILLGGRVRGSGSPYQAAGRYRQIRLGPSVRSRYTVTDDGQAATIACGVDANAAGPCIHLTNWA